MKSYQEDKNIELKVFCFKAFIFTVFAALFFFLLLGTVNPSIVKKKFLEEFHSYKHLIINHLSSMGKDALTEEL